MQIYTGEGKGKTTAALGLALRALGHGARVIIIQFMKGWDSYGELKSAAQFSGMRLVQTGRPDYVYRGSEKREDYLEAERGLGLAREAVASNCCDLLILDEINVALDYGLIGISEVMALLKDRPEGMEIVLTGRGAHKDLIETADLVTEMRETKHPYRDGLQARKGVEF